jgi:hypothetical protein
LSYLGFKGEEDLGDGLKTVWQVEQDINPDNCSGSCGGTTPYCGDGTTEVAYSITERAARDVSRRRTSRADAITGCIGSTGI